MAKGRVFGRLPDMRSQRLESVESDVESVVREILNKLPDGAASLWVSRSTERGLRLLVKPENPHSAPMDISAQNGYHTVFMQIGVNIPIEILVERRTTIVDQVREVVQTVVDGAIEEEVWESNGQVIKSLGRIRLGGRTRTCRRYSGAGLFARGTKTVYRYEPYVSATNRRHSDV